jgi:chromosome condensin MukBEF MukE localization factor
MENETVEQRTDYRFLEDERVEKYFADLNIKLLSGRHIHQDEYNAFSLLEDWYEELSGYYRQLYRLNLARDVYDQSVYYYLDFFSIGKGKISDPSRTRVLTQLQTIVGLMLLDMYYTRYFDNPKTIHWRDILQELEEGEHKSAYQRIFFDAVRPSYTQSEWQSVEGKFNKTIQSFAELGWVNRISGQQEDLAFDIKPAIHRLAKLYEQELNHFTEFASKIIPKQEE